MRVLAAITVCFVLLLPGVAAADPDDSAFHLRNHNSGGAADLSFHYGQPGDTPIAGD
jgi:hypothetical protein